MKVRPSVKRICEKCRNKKTYRVMVICKPKHKQRQG